MTSNTVYCFYVVWPARALQIGSGLNKKRKIDVVGLGQCCLDHIGTIEKFPPVDSKCETDSITIQGGGPVATALVALARWKLNCTLLGVTGDDQFSYEIRASLEKEGIDISGLITRPRSKSQVAFIVVEKVSDAIK